MDDADKLLLDICQRAAQLPPWEVAKLVGSGVLFGAVNAVQSLSTDPVTRSEITEYGGIYPLVQLLKSVTHDKTLEQVRPRTRPAPRRRRRRRRRAGPARRVQNRRTN